MKSSYPIELQQGLSPEHMMHLLEGYRAKNRNTTNGYNESIATHNNKNHSTTKHSEGSKSQRALKTTTEGSIWKVPSRKTHQNNKSSLESTITDLSQRPAQNALKVKPLSTAELPNSKNTAEAASKPNNHNTSAIRVVDEGGHHYNSNVRIEISVHGENYPEGLIIELQEVTDPMHLTKNCKLEFKLAEVPSPVAIT
jgi:hypothetical protein